MLRLSLIRGLAVEVDGERRAVPQSRRGKSLLAWLALNPGVHSRSKVAAVFWPEVLDHSARASLRVALTGLRKALGPEARSSLVTTRETLGLVAGEVWVDVAEVERLVAQSQLAEAVELGDGELLPELDDDWVLEARVHHRERVAELLGRLASEARAAGDLRTAVNWGRRRVDLDPLSEEAVCELIGLLAGVGDHAAAMAAYERLRERLRTTLGIVPSPRTRELVEGLRGQAEAAPDAVADGVASVYRPSDTATAAAPAGALVTLLFTDVVASTALGQAVGDAGAEAVLSEHFESLHQVVRESGGREVKRLGDGLMVAFSSAAAAVHCAAGMQRAVARSNRLHSTGPALSMRVGVHAGEVGGDGGDLSGTPVVVAKRLCDAAAGGQILVSNLVRELVGTRASERFRDCGTLELKGIQGPVAVSELGWDAPGRPAALPALVAANERRPFVGRDEALDAMQALLDEVRQGYRRLAAVSGEPGIGKTRLAARIGAVAHEHGMLVLFGRCSEEPLAPYQPFVEALGPYLAAQPRRDVQTALGPQAGELARLFPELDPGGAPAERQAGAEAEGNRLRLFEALSSLIGGAAHPGGLLLVLDDLHWADQPTLLLLGHLLRAPGEMALMVLATYRDTELTPGHPLQMLLSDLAREELLERQPLSGLSEAQVRRLMALADAPEELAPALHAHTAGNPLFLVELLRERQATGGGAPIGETPEATALTIPESVKALIRRRLARLGEPSERLLRLAAVVGVEFEFGLLERLSELAGEPLADALDAALAARLIDEDRDAYGRFHFLHPLIREALYEDTSRTRRALLHRRVGEALEALHAGALDAHAAELAHHYFEARAGDQEKAIVWAIRAGEAATAKLAYEEAAAHYARALTLETGGESRRCELLLGLGESQWAAGEYRLARRTFVDAAELAEQLGLADELASAALRFGGRAGFDVGVQNPILNSLLERALTLLADEQTALAARVMARLSEALAISPERQRAIELATRSLDLARRIDDKEVLAEVLVRSYWALSNPDNADDQLAMLQEAELLAQEVGTGWILAEAIALQIGPRLERGEITHAAAAYKAGLRLSAEQIQAQYASWLLAMYEAAQAFLDRPIDEVERLVWRAVEVGRTTENPSCIELFVAQIGFVRCYQGRLAEGRAGCEAVADYVVQIPAFRCALAWCYSEVGHAGDARHQLELLAANDFDDLPRDVFWFSCLELLADVCAFLGDKRRAETLYELLAPYADRYIVVATWAVPRGSAQRQLGVLAAAMSRCEDAERHFETALERDQETGSPYALARTRCDFAAMLLKRDARGDRERAGVLLDQALEAAERLGAEGIADRARALRLAWMGEPVERQRSREALRERASALRGQARAAASTRGRSALGKMIDGLTNEELERRFGSPLAQRALLAGMARSFQPRLAFGFEGEIAFELRHPAGSTPARAPDWWTIRVHGKRAVARQGPAGDPAVTLRTDLSTFIRVLAGEDNIIGAMLEDRGQADGDLLVASRLVEVFGGVSPAQILGPLRDARPTEQPVRPAQLSHVEP